MHAHCDSWALVEVSVLSNSYSEEINFIPTLAEETPVVKPPAEGQDPLLQLRSRVQAHCDSLVEVGVQNNNCSEVVLHLP